MARSIEIVVGDEHSFVAGNIRRHLIASPETIPISVLLFAVLFFGIVCGGNFFTATNLSIILQQVTVVGIVGIGQTIVILTGGIDLSVGAMLILSSVVAGRLAVALGVPAPLALMCGLGAGAVCGILNGGLVAYLRLPPFIVTLGSWGIFQALALWFSHNQTISGQQLASAGSIFQILDTAVVRHPALITCGSVLMLLLVLMASYLLSRTALGRHLYAIGDNEESARLAGVNTKLTIITAYALAGVLSAIAGWVAMGRTGVINPTAVSIVNLQSVTAAVVGGASLFGGRGTVMGTLIGTVTVGVFDSGLAIVGADPEWKRFWAGILIITAVGLERWIQRASA
jgi:fructose transport system permease protein